MRTSPISREQALALLQSYNSESFHIQHALTVEGVMRFFARERGFADEEDFWAQAGLLHDIDFERYPEEHCKKAPEILREGGLNEEMIHAVCSHAYGLCSDVEPEHEMEKILFAVDELTGLIGAAALMRPSGSVMDMEVSSLKKKFKDKRFAAGCSRDVIKAGAERLGWPLEELFASTLDGTTFSGSLRAREKAQPGREGLRAFRRRGVPPVLRGRCLPFRTAGRASRRLRPSRRAAECPCSDVRVLPRRLWAGRRGSVRKIPLRKRPGSADVAATPVPAGKTFRSAPGAREPGPSGSGAATCRRAFGVQPSPVP